MNDFDDSDPLATLQYVLDHFSATPGALLYRGPQVWEALEPGTLGQILELHQQPSGILLPRWSEP